MALKMSNKRQSNLAIMFGVWKLKGNCFGLVVYACVYVFIQSWLIQFFRGLLLILLPLFSLAFSLPQFCLNRPIVSPSLLLSKRLAPYVHLNNLSQKWACVIMRRSSSPLGHVALHTWPTLHHVWESALFASLVSCGGSEVRLGLVFVFWDGLGAEARARIIRLILVEALESVVGSASLGQSPARLIFLGGRVGGCVGTVTSGTDRGGGRSLVGQTLVATLKAERILRSSSQLRSLLG